MQYYLIVDTTGAIKCYCCCKVITINEWSMLNNLLIFICKFLIQNTTTVYVNKCDDWWEACTGIHDEKNNTKHSS